MEGRSMAVTESKPHLVGHRAPEFTLPDTVSGNKAFANPLDLRAILSKQATVIIFMCNHCPFVKHILPKLTDIARTYQAKGISFAAISANDAEKFPDDAPDKMRELAVAQKFSFPYLYDETQAVAKAYDAQCTPEFFVLNANGICVYHGQFDASTPGNGIPVTGESLIKTLDAILAGRPVDPHQKPSIGCNIKWK
jgi:thiol-disulfide isomerase/thioredoxin